MFEYNYNPKTKILNITLPQELQFDFEFLNKISEMIQIVEMERRECRQIRISSPRNTNYPKMCKAYMFNVWRYLGKKHWILWNVELNNAIGTKVKTVDGGKFQDIDVYETLASESLNDYRFSDAKSADAAVKELVRIIVEKNFTIDKNEVSDFLITAIGEIFSNAFLHSDREEAFLIYDIENDVDDYYLSVTVIDYGKTIIQNVRRFLLEEEGRNASSIECMEWAVIELNTTRKGSGGYGLSTLIDLIKNARGELTILSGDTYYKLNQSGVKTGNVAGIFLGTTVTFRIKLFETKNIIAYDKKNEKLISFSLDDL